VKVYFLVYQKTPEEKALQLIARKLSAAGLIEGRIGDGGLADQADDENIAIALAKSLIKREAVEDFNMEEIALGLRENDPFEDYYLNVCEEIDRARSEKEAKAQAQAVAKDDNALDGSLIVNTINAKAKAESAKTINAEAKAESASAINVIGRAESVKALQSIVSSESTPSLFDDVLNAPLTSVVQALKESAVKEEEEPEAIANVAEAEANANDKANANAGNEANADNRLTIYRIVKSGGGKRVEQKLNLTASELEEITADDSQASFFQRSLFDF
jgi:hypothetical protein